VDQDGRSLARLRTPLVGSIPFAPTRSATRLLLCPTTTGRIPVFVDVFLVVVSLLAAFGALEVRNIVGQAREDF
jgi:hypothetical protein